MQGRVENRGAAKDENAQTRKPLFDDGKPHSPYEILKAYAERKYIQYTEESNE